MKELHIKHTRLNYDSWQIDHKEYYQTYMETENFTGYLALLKIIKNDHCSVWNWHGREKLRVSATGVRWLMILPPDGRYCIKMMVNPKGKCFLWYIDMCDSIGIDADGTYYINDLFLDLLVHPSGEIVVGDRDELDGALEQKVITEEQYNKALATAQELTEGLLKDIDKFKKYCFARLEDIYEQLDLPKSKSRIHWLERIKSWRK